MVHVLGTGRQLSPPGPDGSLLYGNLYPLVVLYLPECCQEITQKLGFRPYFLFRCAFGLCTSSHQSLYGDTLLGFCHHSPEIQILAKLASQDRDSDSASTM